MRLRSVATFAAMCRACVKVNDSVPAKVKLSVMLFSNLECRAENLLPVADGLLLGWGGQRGIDRVAGIERGINDRVGLRGRTELAAIVPGVDGLDALHRLGERAAGGCGVVVGEGDEFPARKSVG